MSPNILLYLADCSAISALHVTIQATRRIHHRMGNFLIQQTSHLGSMTIHRLAKIPKNPQEIPNKFLFSISFSTWVAL